MTFAATLALSVPLVLLDAAVLATLWRWFAVPLGAPAVGLAHMVGIATLVGLGTHQFVPTAGMDNRERAVGAIADGLVAPTFALLVGWIALQFA